MGANRILKRNNQKQFYSMWKRAEKVSGRAVKKDWMEGKFSVSKFCQLFSNAFSSFCKFKRLT